MRKILVTGGFGYLGGRICTFLKDKGYSITIFERKDNADLPSWVKDMKIVYGDITDASSFNNCFRNINSVIHLAAVNEKVCETNPRLAYLVNCLGTQNALEEAKKAGCKKFIYLSTFHIYGQGHGRITESTVPNPTHLYGLTHFIGEQLCKKYTGENFRTIMLRFSNGIGAPAALSVDRWSLVVNELCKSAILNKKVELKSSGTQLRDFVSIDDLCSMIYLALSIKDSKLGDGIFNVGSGKSVSVKEIAELVAKEYRNMYNQEAELIIPKTEQEKSEPLQYVIDKARAIGFNPSTDLREEIRKTLKACEGFKKS